MKIIQLKACNSTILDIISEYLWIEWGIYYSSKEDLKNSFKYSKNLTYVLFDNDEFVGLYTLNWMKYIYLFLSDVFIIPNQRKKNYGKVLVLHAKSIANTMNNCLYLYCYKDYINFYKRYGFDVISFDGSKYLLFNRFS